MERLTQKVEDGYSLKLDNPKSDIEARQQLMEKYKIAIKKLGMLEDIMEQTCFTDAETCEKAFSIYKFAFEDVCEGYLNMFKALLRAKPNLNYYEGSYKPDDDNYNLEFIKRYFMYPYKKGENNGKF